MKPCCRQRRLFTLSAAVCLLLISTKLDSHVRCSLLTSWQDRKHTAGLIFKPLCLCFCRLFVQVNNTNASFPLHGAFFCFPCSGQHLVPYLVSPRSRFAVSWADTKSCRKNTADHRENHHLHDPGYPAQIATAIILPTQLRFLENCSTQTFLSLVADERMKGSSAMPCVCVSLKMVSRQFHPASVWRSPISMQRKITVCN